MKYLNKYANTAAYTADAARAALTRSNVSLIEDGTGIKVDGFNVLISKETCGIGDIAVYDKATATKRFIKAGTYNAASLPANIIVVGVVYNRTGNTVRIVAKNNATGGRWAAGYTQKISGFVVAGGSFTVTVNTTTTAAIAYTYADTSSLAAIAAAIAAAFTTAGIANWTVTADTVNNCIIAEYNFYTAISAFQVTDADSHVVTAALNSQYQTTLSGVVTPYGSIGRQGGVFTSYAGANFDRFKAYYSISGADETGKDATYTGVLKESRFNNTDNPVLYALYAGSYDAYLLGQCVKFPSYKGAVIDKNGKTNTTALAAVTWNNASGVAQPAYPAANNAKIYAVAEAVGFGAGDWWLPSCEELFILLRDVSAVNTSLSAIGGTQVSTTTSYWSSSEYSAAHAWFYYSYGSMCYYSKYYSSSNVRAVTAF
jgi:hypothetical protein